MDSHAGHCFLELLPLNPETEEVVRSPDNKIRCEVDPTSRRGRTRGPTNTPPPGLEDEKMKLCITLGHPQKQPSRSFTTFGRSKDSCDIAIDFPTVSFEHCHLEYDPSSQIILLRDTSTNGTFFGSNSKWCTYPYRALLAVRDMNLLTEYIKIDAAEFALRPAVNAGTPAHKSLLEQPNRCSQRRLNDPSLTEVKSDARSYRPTMQMTRRGKFLHAPEGFEIQRLAVLGSGAHGTLYKALDMHTGKYYV
jgi:FHA domain